MNRLAMFAVSAGLLAILLCSFALLTVIGLTGASLYVTVRVVRHLAGSAPAEHSTIRRIWDDGNGKIIDM